MDPKIPTERQIQLFNKACADTDYTLVEYFLYYYEMPFIDGYRLGNRLIKRLIKKDCRRRDSIKMFMEIVTCVPDERMLLNIDLKNLYRDYNNICHSMLFDRSKKLDGYLITKALIIFLIESGNNKSKSAIKRLPLDLIRYATTFF